MFSHGMGDGRTGGGELEIGAIFSLGTVSVCLTWSAVTVAPPQSYSTLLRVCT